MITNPENVFESLQNDVAARVRATSGFTALKFPDGRDWFALTEDEGDIQFEFDTMIAQIGLAVVVQACTGKVTQPEMWSGTGLLIGDVSFDVWISEAPLFNRSDAGTKLRLSHAMVNLMGSLHQFQPASIQSPIYFDGWDKARERVYTAEKQSVGTLITSRIMHFKAPQIAAEITQ